MLVEKFSLPSNFFERNIAGLIFVVKLFKRTEFFQNFASGLHSNVVSKPEKTSGGNLNYWRIK